MLKRQAERAATRRVLVIGQAMTAGDVIGAALAVVRHVASCPPSEMANDHKGETPDDKPEDYERMGRPSKKSPPRRNKTDGSVWEADKDGHGGSKWKRWPSVRDWEKDRGQHPYVLGGVDKFEPVSGAGEMDHSEEAVGQLVIAGGDGAVDFEMAEHAFDAIALLVERPVMLDLHASV